jgi:hypothetical protein
MNVKFPRSKADVIIVLLITKEFCFELLTNIKAEDNQDKQLKVHRVFVYDIATVF